MGLKGRSHVGESGLRNIPSPEARRKTLGALVKFVLTLGAGIVLGYALHTKKDESLDTIATGIVDFIISKRKVVRDRFAV